LVRIRHPIAIFEIQHYIGNFENCQFGLKSIDMETLMDQAVNYQTQFHPPKSHQFVQPLIFEQEIKEFTQRTGGSGDITYVAYLKGYELIEMPELVARKIEAKYILWSDIQILKTDQPIPMLRRYVGSVMKEIILTDSSPVQEIQIPQKYDCRLEHISLINLNQDANLHAQCNIKTLPKLNLNVRSWEGIFQPDGSTPLIHSPEMDTDLGGSRKFGGLATPGIITPQFHNQMNAPIHRMVNWGEKVQIEASADNAGSFSLTAMLEFSFFQPIL
jgi:hypothetical protein